MNALWGKCTDCGHVWPVAHLPMEMTRAAELAKRAACPKCGASSGIKVASKADIPAEGAA
ncbi:MAG: hypothetical protein ACK4MX_11460 [Thermaurantiacus sp.]